MAGLIGYVDHDPDHEQLRRYLARLTKDIFGTEFSTSGAAHSETYSVDLCICLLESWVNQKKNSTTNRSEMPPQPHRSVPSSSKEPRLAASDLNYARSNPEPLNK